MKATNKRQLIFLVISFIALSSVPVKAWGPIAHYSISNKAGFDANAICMNLPDAWPNREWIIFVTKWFAWTHAVQTSGSNWGVPNLPIYPEDGRYPGYDMYQLLTRKLTNTNGSEINTVYGFIGHNAMDSIVHYDYFLGGTIDNWRIQHGEKEEWADYEIYLRSSYANGSFDMEGRPVSFWGIAIVQDDPSQVIIPCSGDMSLLRMAQKVYRKNRRITSNNSTDHLNEIDSIAQINDRIQNLQNDINNGLKKLNNKRLIELRQKAELNGWTLDELESKINESISVTQKRISGAGN